MPGLLQALSIQWDLWTKRYQAFYASSVEEINGCVTVLESVRRQELNRVSGDSVLSSHAFAGEELNYKLAGCRDTKSGRIIGCIRLTNALETKSIPSSREEYQLDLFDDQLLSGLSIFTRLAVLKTHRSSPAALVLISFCFISILEEGGQGLLMSCEPNLFPMYKRLGLRPIGPLHNSPSGGYRVPMICIPDLDYFRAIRNPALPLIKHIDYDRSRMIRKWYSDFIFQHGEIQVGLSFYDEAKAGKDLHNDLTDGLSDKGLKLLLKNALTVKCKEGDLLIAEDDGGKGIGFIRSGLFEVRARGKTLALLGEGDIFGEIAYVLHTNRSAEIITVSPDAEVVLFSVSAIKRLDDDADRAVIWKNLSRVLARRLLMTNKVLYSENDRQDDQAV